MKAKDLAKKLMEHPDFDVKFVSGAYKEDTGGPLIWDSWKNVNVCDIGHSDKVIVLSGEIE